MNQREKKRQSPGHFLGKKNNRGRKGASEVIGTLLLVGIGVSLFALLSIVTFTMPTVFFSDPTPSVNIIGRIQGNSVIFEHYGGRSISLDTEISIMFAETRVVMTVGDALDAASKADGVWNIGEELKIPNNNPNLPIMAISVIITDKSSNTVIMRGILQEGSQAVNPIAVTLQADSIATDSAKIHMFYDFRYYLGTKKVCFTYIKASDYITNSSVPWGTTGWVDVFSQNGSYNCNLVGLNENTEYLYQAWVQFNSSLNASVKLTSPGQIRSFRTQSYSSGMWHFDEPSGIIVIDSSNNGNNGTFFPADEHIGPQRLNQSNLIVNNRSLRFDGVNDYVIVNHATSLSPTTEIAIEGWVYPEHQNEWKGTNLQTIDSTMYGIQAYGCLEPDIINISNNCYAIVSRNSVYGGFIVTMDVSNNGNITKNPTSNLLDIYQFETVRCETPKIIKVRGSSNVYAIVYRGPGSGSNYYLYMTTIKISSDGIISKPFIDKKVIDSLNSFYPDIVYTDNDFYAVVYSVFQNYLAQNRYVGRLQIAQITSVGVISAQKSYYNFGASGSAGGIMQYLDIIHIKNDYYSVVFRDSDTDGSMRALQIKNGFVVFVDNTVYKFDNNNISDLPLRIVHVYDKIYSVLYGDKDGTIIRGAALISLQISDTGTFDDTIDYALLLPPADWTLFSQHDILYITGDIFAMTYRLGSRAEVKTFEISNLGFISNHTNDPEWKYIFQPTSSFTISTPKMIRINATFNTFLKPFAIVYPKTISNDINNGILLTIKIADNGSILHRTFDSALLGPVNFYAPDIVHVYDDIYATVSRAVLYGNMALHTVRISNLGDVENTFIDTLHIPMPETTPGSSIKIIHAINNIFLVVFDNYGTPALSIKTVKIADDGIIQDNILCSYNITKTGYSNFCSPSIIPIKNDVFAVTYHSTNYASKSDFISTIQISPTGNITLLDTLTMNGYFSSVYGYDEYTDILPIQGSNHLYALVYGYDYFIPGQHRGAGILFTIEITDAGAINQIPLNTYTFDTYGCSRPDIITISNITYGLCYSKSVWVNPYQISGNLITLTISTDGLIIQPIESITYTKVNTNYDLAHCQYLDHLYQNVYALIYTIPSGSTARGYISTLAISESGAIYRTSSNAIFDAQRALKTSTNILPSFINISNTLVGLCYQGDYDDGYIETIQVTLTDTTNQLKNIISKSGSYAIKGNQTVFTATLRTTSGDKTLSIPAHTGWNYLVLTYDHTRIKFFNNLTNVSLPCNENIVGTTNPLIFGNFKGIYDEFALYKIHLRDDQIYDHYTSH